MADPAPNHAGQADDRPTISSARRRRAISARSVCHSHPLQELVEKARIVARVVDDVDAEGREFAVERHRRLRNEVSTPDHANRNDFTGNSAARVSLAWDSGSSVIWAPRRNRGIRASRYRADLLGGSRNVEHVQQRADYPTHWRKAVGAWIYFCPVRLPKLLVPAEFVMNPAPAPFGGMLDPSPTPVLPMSASAVC